MKRTLLIIITIFNCCSIIAQMPQCLKIYNQADDLRKLIPPSYEKAIKKIRAAKLCDRNNEKWNEKCDQLILDIYKSINQERINAVASEKIAVNNLATAFKEKGYKVSEEGDFLSAKVLFSKSLFLNDSWQSRKALIETWNNDLNTVKWNWTSEKHNEEIIGIEFLNDNRILVVSKFGNLIFLETSTGNILDTLSLKSKVKAFSVSKNHKRIALSGQDSLLKIYNLENGFLEKKIELISDPIKIEFNPERNEIAVGFEFYGIQYINFEEEKEQWSEDVHGMTAQCIEFSNDGNSIFWAGNNEYLWMSAVDSLEPNRLLSLNGYTSDISLSDEGNYFAVVNSNRDILAINLYEKGMISLYGHTNEISSLSFSHDEKLLASGGYDKMVRIWEMNTGKQILSLPEFPDVVKDVKFCGEAGKYVIIILCNDNRIRQCEILFNNIPKIIGEESNLEKSIREFKNANPSITHPLENALKTNRYKDQILWTDFLNDSLLIIGSKDGINMKIWNVNNLTIVDSIEQRLDILGAKSVILSENKKLLVSFFSLFKKEINVYNIKAKRQVLKKEFKKDISSIAMASDNSTIFIGFQDGSIETLEIESGKMKLIWKDSMDPMAIEFINNETLAIGYSNGLIQLIDIKRRKELSILSEHTRAITRIEYLSDKSTLISLSLDNSIKIWDLKNYKLQKSLDIYASDFTISKDKKFLIVAGMERKVILYNTENFNKNVSLSGHVKSILAVAANPNNTILVSGGEDNQVYLWDFETFHFYYHSSPETILNHVEKESGMSFKGFELIFTPKLVSE